MDKTFDLFPFATWYFWNPLFVCLYFFLLNWAVFSDNIDFIVINVFDEFVVYKKKILKK